MRGVGGETANGQSVLECLGWVALGYVWNVTRAVCHILIGRGQLV